MPGDGNAQTIEDPMWAPLGAPQTNHLGVFNRTPNFPAYPSGHATFGTTCFELVRRFFAEKQGVNSEDVTLGDSLGFDLVSDEFDGKNKDPDGMPRTPLMRQYTLNGAIKDNVLSRVFLGVHWRFDGAEFSNGSINYASKVGGAGAGFQIAKDIFPKCFPAIGTKQSVVAQAAVGGASPKKRRS